MRNRVTLYLGIIMLILMILSIIVYLRQDHIAPVINVPDDNLTYIEGQDTGVLLAGVTASDDRDDNLSASVRIYDIAVLDNGTQAVVTYAVYDKSNNLGKASRLVNYMAKHDDASKMETGDNIINGDADDKDTSSTEQTGDDKTTEEEKISEEPVEEGYDDPELISYGAPVIRLSTHEVHIDVGEYFYTMDYVDDAVDDIDTKEYLYRNMYLDSVYDEYTPGVYELIYFCVDSDGNRSNDAKLRLYVGQDED